jgi:putative SOS response-associated peptidase YedK
VKDGLSLESTPHFTAMCGRYASFLPAEFIARLFATLNPLPNLAPTWNMAPTMDAPVVRLHSNGERHLDVLKWGLLPYFTKDREKARKPINARSETILKSMFGCPSPAVSFHATATRMAR